MVCSFIKYFLTPTPVMMTIVEGLAVIKKIRKHRRQCEQTVCSRRMPDQDTGQVAQKQIILNFDNLLTW